MFEFERIAEQRILEAIARGDLDRLPGAGAPLNLDDDSLVPPEMRLTFRVLKNAGYVPEEVRLRREISDFEAVMRDPGGDPAPRHALKRLALLKTRLAARCGREPALHLDAVYRDKLLNALAKPSVKANRSQK